MCERCEQPPFDTEHVLPPILTGLVHEIDRDVERFALDRAYMVAGGTFLSTAHRLGWPAADRALSFVLAVRRLANINLPPEGTGERRDRDRAFEHYKAQRDTLLKWLGDKAQHDTLIKRLRDDR